MSDEIDAVDLRRALDVIVWPGRDVPPEDGQALQALAGQTLDSINRLQVECGLVKARKDLRNAQIVVSRQERAIRELTSIKETLP